jgi:hypothetical protein
VRHPITATVLAALSTVLATGGTAVWALGDAAPRGAGIRVEAPAAPAPQAAAAAARLRRCGPEPTDAAGWSAVFDRLDGDWAGGDTALSARLADGRLLWVFGDSFVGDVRADGSRAAGSRIVRNSVLVSDGGCVDAATPGRTSLPGRGGTWLWPTSVVARPAPGGATSVVVFAQRMRSTGAGAWSFERVGAAAVELRAAARGAVTVGPVRDLPGTDVLWGAGSAQRGGTVYLYGTREVRRPLVMGRELLVARAPLATVSDVRTWSYRTGSGWSRDAARAAVVLPAETGVSTTPAVVVADGAFRIVTKPQEVFDERIVVMSSSTPYGPWTSRVVLRSPSTQARPTYSPAVVATRAGSGSVVVVSRTSTSLRELMADASAARPDFYDVDLAG